MHCSAFSFNASNTTLHIKYRNLSQRHQRRSFIDRINPNPRWGFADIFSSMLWFDIYILMDASAKPWTLPRPKNSPLDCFLNGLSSPIFA